HLLLAAGRGDGGLASSRAARGQQAGHGEERAARETAAQELLAAELRLGHAATSSDRSTTNTASGENDSSSRSPAACDTAPWAYTETWPKGVLTTYCVETPTYARSTISPARRFTPVPSMWSFSGRMPTETSPVRPSSALGETWRTSPLSSLTLSGPATRPGSRLDTPRKLATNGVRGCS